jgi:N-acyl-D-amino-acid deacylase
MSRRISVIACAICALLLAPVTTKSPLRAQTADAQPFDLVIRNGHIIDGTGSPWYSGDIGIRDGRISSIGNLANAPTKRAIDAQGLTVAPGFIDMLGQSESTILVDPHVPSKIYQGITTEITGEGGSAAPQSDATLAEDHLDYEHYGIKPDWKTFREYFARLEKQGIGINLASYVGATQVRRVVIGNADRAPTAAELEEMKRLVRQAMEEGARGVSTALEYAPAPYASTDELIALAAESAKYGGLYATHMRNEGSGIMAALEETARIAREAHTPVEIWHLKVAGVASWGHMPEVVKFIDDARASGLDIAADTYAYTAWNNSMSAFIPPWAHDGGDDKLIERLKDPATRARIRKDMMTPTKAWDNEWQEIPGPDAILISSVLNPDLLPLQGKRLSEIAKAWAVPSHGPASHEPRAVRPSKDPIDTICDLLIQDHAATYVSVFGMQESDVELALKQPWVSVDNDSSGTSPEGILGQDHPHPRAYGTFPRILSKFVREEKLLTLPDAVRKFTSLPAQRMRITDRGVLKQGMWADVVIFDPATIHDVATFENPNQFSVGMKYVIVNGTPVIAEGKMTTALPGNVLRGPGYRGAN